MKRISHTVAVAPTGFILGGCLAASIVIGWIDFATGIYLSFSLFYLLPIGIVAWRLGKGIGMALALFSSLLGLSADLYSGAGGHGLLPYWNSAARLGIFLGATWIIVRLTTSLEAQIQLARTDPLTGAINARWFGEVARRELAGSHRYQTPLTLAYVDLDDFKQVNDTMGHSVGDDLLKTVAETIGETLRPTDVVARLGGDEFAVLLPNTDLDSAAAAFGRIRALLQTQMEVHGWDVTFSVGIAAVSQMVGSVDDLLSYADSLMYEAKRTGKDRIVCDPADRIPA